MVISVTNKIDTFNLDKTFEPNIAIKATLEEIKVLREAAKICDELRIAFDRMEIFDSKVPGVTYENLLEIADLVEDYGMGEKCNA